MAGEGLGRSQSPALAWWYSWGLCLSLPTSTAALGPRGGCVNSFPLGWSLWVGGEGAPCSQALPPQLLFQENNPGVHYEYTIPREATRQSLGLLPEFFWTYGPWTECTVTCGTGEEGALASSSLLC